MTTSIKLLLGIVLMVNLVMGSCNTLCATCSSDGFVCEVCIKGHGVNSKGVCQVSNLGGIIAGSVIGGAILLVIVIIVLWLCIKKCNKPFPNPN
jgi:hypothetical protein